MKVKIIFRCLAFVVFALFVSQSNAAIVIEQQASLSVGTLYNSNIEMAENADPIWLYLAVPTYGISLVDDRNTWFANGALNVQRSSNKNISQDRQDPSLLIGWKRELENGNFGLSTSYIRTSTRARQFRETGLLFEDGTDTTRSYNVNWKHLFSERTDLAVDAGYDKTTFGLTQGGDSNVFSDSSSKRLVSTLTHKYTDTISPYITLGFFDFRASNQIKYQNYLAGVVVQASPQFSYDISAGNTHFSSSGSNEWIWAAKANYTANRYTLDSSLSRSVIATDVGNTELIDTITFGYNYQLSEKSRWGLLVNLGENKSLNPNKTQQLTASYSRDLTSAWLMSLFLETRNIKNQNTDSVQGTSVGVNFTYTTPKF